MATVTAAAEPAVTRPDRPPGVAGRRARAPRVLRLSLPKGTARLAAAAAGWGASAIAAWALGVGNVGAIELLTLVASALLLGGAIALGLRTQAILTVALLMLVPGAGLVAQQVLIEPVVRDVADLLVSTALVPAFVVLVFTVIVLRGTFDARSITSGLAVAAVCAVVATAGPLLSYYGIGRLIASGSGLLLLCATAVAPLTWLFSGLGRMALNAGAAIAAGRDACFRVLASIAAVVAALWCGAAVERLVTRAAQPTPLEGLASSAGWTIAAALGLALLWVVQRLPVWLMRRQLGGRYESTAIGDSLGFISVACLAAAVAWRIDSGVPPGPAAVIALVAGGAYAAVRLHFAAPVRTRNAPLWIVLVGEPDRRVTNAVSRLAREWRAGQVTLVAAPPLAARNAGEHARLAASARALATLFPTRAVHLEDWVDAQPDHWPALPVRELYAPGELWPVVFGQQLAPSAAVVTLMSTGSDVGVSVVPISVASRLRPTLSLFDALPLAPIKLNLAAGLARVNELQPAATRTVVRHVMLLSAVSDLPLAERVARRLQGERDGADRLVECWPVAWASGALATLMRMPFGMWRHAGLFLTRLYEQAAPGGGVLKLYAAVVRLTLGRDWSGEFELVVIERGATASTFGLAPSLVETAVRSGVLTRLISVRLNAPDADTPLTYTANAYAGEVRVVSPSPDAAADQIAQRLLRLALQPVAVGPQPVAAALPVEPVTATAAAPEPPPIEDEWSIWGVTVSESRGLRHEFLPAGEMFSVERWRLESAWGLLDSVPVGMTIAGDVGATLARQLLPDGAARHFQQNLILVVDEDSAGVPWELLRPADDAAALPFALTAGLPRQPASRVPDDWSRRAGTEWRDVSGALIINAGSVGAERPSGLDHMRAMARVLELGSPGQVELIDAEASPGVRELLFKRDWSIVHMTAAITDSPGLVLEPQSVFFVEEFAGLRRPPRLVFVNCFLPDARSPRVYATRAAKLAQGILATGVAAVVVNGWPLDSMAAMTFGERLYLSLFSSAPFGDAVRRARQVTYERHPEIATWGAYQCYGAPGFRLRGIDVDLRQA